MSVSIRTEISQVVSAIKSLETKLKPLAEHYGEVTRSLRSEKAPTLSIDYWQALSMCDSLNRVRNLIENNFLAIETLGVLSLARYTFELVIQLKRIDKDPIFAIVYAREVLEQQIEHHKKMVDHLHREIALYRQLAARETAEQRGALATASDPRKPESGADLGKRLAEAMKTVASAIDAELATALTLYSDDAKVYGFAYQARRLETQALPQLLTVVSSNQESLNELNKVWKETLSNSKYVVNKWSKRAEQVGMTTQYEFIYSFTSRLLHATPVSISTAQQCLQDDEILLFFKFIYAEFLWIIRRAEENKKRAAVH